MRGNEREELGAPWPRRAGSALQLAVCFRRGSGADRNSLGEPDIPGSRRAQFQSLLCEAENPNHVSRSVKVCTHHTCRRRAVLHHNLYLVCLRRIHVKRRTVTLMVRTHNWSKFSTHADSTNRSDYTIPTWSPDRYSRRAAILLQTHARQADRKCAAKLVCEFAADARLGPQVSHDALEQPWRVATSDQQSPRRRPVVAQIAQAHRARRPQL